MPTSRIRSYPLISHGGIRGRIILGALGPLVCRNWRIRRRSLIYTMRFPTAVRQIAIGRYISSSKDMVAGVPFISTKSILGAAVGGNSSLGGENLRGVRTCAVSFEFAKSWGADIRRDCAAQYPMLRKITRPLGMSTTCKVTCCPRPMLLPQLQSTGLVLRELPCFVPQRCCNMWRLGATRRVSHFAPLGQFASRAGMGARARASNFGPKSIRRHRRARTGFRRFDCTVAECPSCASVAVLGGFPTRPLARRHSIASRIDAFRAAGCVGPRDVTLCSQEPSASFLECALRPQSCLSGTWTSLP